MEQQADFNNLMISECMAKYPSRFTLPYLNWYIDEKKGGAQDRQYIGHIGWATRMLKEIAPKLHTDISSNTYWLACVSAYYTIQAYDFHPPPIPELVQTVGKADLIKLPFEDGSLESVSCMHTVEHVGLGRFGDPINYDGDMLAMNELKRVLKPGGHLLLVVPMFKRSTIVFNAHRLYAPKDLLAFFPLDQYIVHNFTMVPNKSDKPIFITQDIEKSLEDEESYSGCCGCLWVQSLELDQ